MQPAGDIQRMRRLMLQGPRLTAEPDSNSSLNESIPGVAASLGRGVSVKHNKQPKAGWTF